MSRESGMASFKAVAAVALLVALVFLGIKLVPPYFSNYQFQDEMNAIARIATYAEAKTEAGVRNDVLAKAKELKLPVKEEQITVVKGPYGVNIEVKYEVKVEVPGHTFNLKFNPLAGNKMITAK